MMPPSSFTRVKDTDRKGPTKEMWKKAETITYFVSVQITWYFIFGSIRQSFILTVYFK